VDGVALGAVSFMVQWRITVRQCVRVSAQNFRSVTCSWLPQEGTGHAVPQAWVEIVFDNADGRLGVRHQSGGAERTACMDDFRAPNNVLYACRAVKLCT
jgi:hypothetical protein